MRGQLIDSSKRGVWTLTEKRNKVDLHAFVALRYFKESHQSHSLPKEDTSTAIEGATGELGCETELTGEEELLDILKGFPPSGFERSCQRLLRENAFQQVTLTGRSGDGGIDEMIKVSGTPQCQGRAPSTKGNSEANLSRRR